MPTYKLYYFPIKARAELSRLLFAVAQVEYEDIRIPFSDWPKRKQEMEFGQMPVLEVDGKRLTQGYAIARYLAREFGFAGKDKWEAAQADMYTGVVEDLFMPIVRIRFAKDEKTKADLKQKFLDETGPNFLTPIEKSLSTGSGYLVGDGLTYADLALISLLDFLESGLQADAKPFLAEFPTINKFRQRIEALPKIAAWISKRPHSDR